MSVNIHKRLITCLFPGRNFLCLPNVEGGGYLPIQENTNSLQRGEGDHSGPCLRSDEHNVTGNLSANERRIGESHPPATLSIPGGVKRF